MIVDLWLLVLQQCKVTLISKAKVQENHGKIQNYGKHPTPQIINEYTAYENSIKQYAVFIEFPFSELVKFSLWKPDLLHLHKPNSTLFRFYVTFCLIIGQYTFAL